jgi:class III poly(R)-hydroxyalkanoic acid synthase PhaE subunit
MPVNQQDDLEALSRRYWAAWSEALRGAASGAMPGMGGFAGMSGIPGMSGMPGMAGMPGVGPSMGNGSQGWHEAIDWWTKLAQGGSGQADDTLARFNTQARQWYGQMQQVAARFAGQDASAADVARAWKESFAATGSDPFAEMLRSMRGQGLHGMEQWVEGAAPWMRSIQYQADALLRTPTFGFAREHQERAQALARAQLEYQQETNAYNALMMQATQDAFAIFESRLASHEEPGRQVTSARALFDVWIDAAEEAYARIALSPEFREAYGRMVNAQMRLRGCVQRAVEDACAQFGMPTRTELDGAHRKLAQLEREVRKLRDAVAQGQGGRVPAANAAPEAAAKAPAKPRPRPVAKAVAARKVTKSAAGKAAKKAAGKVEKKSATSVATKGVNKASKKTSKTSAARAARSAPGAKPRALREVARKSSRSKAEGFGSVIANAIPQAPRPMPSRGGKSKAKGKR